MNLQNIALTSAGATADPFTSFGSPYQSYYVSGTATLAANVSFASTTSEQGGSYIIWWDADITLSTFSVTIEGQVINQDSLNQGGIFNVYYNGSAWVVSYSANGIEQPQENRGVNSVAVPSGGGTLTLVAGVNNQYQRFSSSAVTLSSNYTVTAATSGVKDGTTFLLDFVGGITNSGNTVTAFGVSIPDAQALAGGMAVLATYDATANVWRAITINKPVTLASLSSQAANSIVGNATNASAVPTAIPITTNGYVLKRESNALVGGLITSSNFDPSILSTQFVKLNITNAQLLTGFTIGGKLVDAAGAGTMVVPINAQLRVVFGSAAFTTNLNFFIGHTGASNSIMRQTGGLGAASTLMFNFFPTTGTINTSQLIENAGLDWGIETGNPAVGTGTSAVLYVQYATILL
jgi:hypothetical protein